MKSSRNLNKNLLKHLKCCTKTDKMQNLPRWNIFCTALIASPFPSLPGCGTCGTRGHWSLQIIQFLSRQTFGLSHQSKDSLEVDYEAAQETEKWQRRFSWKKQEVLRRRHQRTSQHQLLSRIPPYHAFQELHTSKALLQIVSVLAADFSTPVPKYTRNTRLL